MKDVPRDLTEEDPRALRIEKLRIAVQSGTYLVDDDDVAARMLDSAALFDPFAFTPHNIQ